MTTWKAAAGLLTVLAVGVLLPAWAGDADERIADLEARLAELEERLAGIESQDDPAALEELRRQVDVLSQEIEDLKLGEAADTRADERDGLGPAAAKVYAKDRGVSIGGYGEMLYQNFASTDEDGAPSNRTDELDFLRAVFYFGYKFNDWILFNSEIEYEHASTERDGSVSVEFAYLDFLLRDELGVRAGLLLMPMGFINELHEPPTFLGAARPLVDRYLIPTTWRENGAGVHGDLGDFSYRSYVVTGLEAVAGGSSNVSGFSATGIRGGRTSGSKSSAEDLAWVGRFDWTGIDGLMLGASVYFGGAGQGALTPAGAPVDTDVTLWEVHGEYRARGWFARLLFVETDISNVASINAAQGFTGNQSVGERQYGGYAELGYDTFNHRDTRQALIPYLRFERFNTQEQVPAGFSADPANDVDVMTVGVSYKPILNVAIKADYNFIGNAAGTGVDQLNVAVGFLF